MNFYEFSKLASVLGCRHMVKSAEPYTLGTSSQSHLLNRMPQDSAKEIVYLNDFITNRAKKHKFLNAHSGLNSFIKSLDPNATSIETAAIPDKVKNAIRAAMEGAGFKPGRGDRFIAKNFGGKTVSLSKLNDILEQLTDFGEQYDGYAIGNRAQAKARAVINSPLNSSRQAKEVLKAITENPKAYANFNEASTFVNPDTGFFVAPPRKTEPISADTRFYESWAPRSRHATKYSGSTEGLAEFSNIIHGGKLPTPKAKAVPGIMQAMEDAKKFINGSDILSAASKNPLLNIPGVKSEFLPDISIPKAQAQNAIEKAVSSVTNNGTASAVDKAKNAIEKAVAKSAPEASKATAAVAKALPWFKRPSGKIGLGLAGLGGLGTIIGTALNRDK